VTHQVVGWSGIVIEMGAGLKEAVIFDPATGRYASAATRSRWHTRQEIEDLAARGIVTFRDLHEDVVSDGVVLYATHDLVQPSAHDRLRLDPNPLVLHIVGGEPVWLGYLPRVEALALLRRWADDLLLDAKGSLNERWGVDQEMLARRVLDSARRARFCISARDTALRYEMFKIMAIATRLLRQSLDPTYLDASIDLSPTQVEQLRAEVDSFAPDVAVEIDRSVPPVGRMGHPPRKHAEAA
jgi:hypothetical protein